MRSVDTRPLVVVLIVCTGLVSIALSCNLAPRGQTPVALDRSSSPPEERAHATPSSQQPAAGICAEPAGSVARLTIYPDIPDPRCSRVTPGHYLEVVNATEEPIQVSIGDQEARIRPGEEHRFNLPLGDFLLPGVHQVLVEPCCGPEIWLVESGQ